MPKPELTGGPPQRIYRLDELRWGELQARTERRGRARPVNDTWIAACCLVRDLPLATFNLKDFEDFAEYDGLRIIGVNER